MWTVFREDERTHTMRVLFVSLRSCRVEVTFPGLDDEDCTLEVDAGSEFPELGPRAARRIRWDGATSRVNPMCLSVLWVGAKGELHVFFRALCLFLRRRIGKCYSAALQESLHSVFPWEICDLIRSFAY